MSRICEVCGRIEEVEKEENPYDIIDVCPECTQHLIHPAPTLESE